ncbi:MAG: hypothetical protein ACR2L2_14045 [Acidobacteriota bacterium]
MVNDLPQLLSKFAELPFPDQDDVLTLVRCLEPAKRKSNLPTILFKKKYDRSSLEIIAKACAVPSHQLDRFFRGLLPVVQSPRIVCTHLVLDRSFSISLFHFTADIVLPQAVHHNCTEVLILLHGDIEATFASDGEELIFDLAFSEGAQIPEGGRHLFRCASGSSCLSVCLTADNIDPAVSVRGETFGKQVATNYHRRPLSIKGRLK